MDEDKIEKTNETSEQIAADNLLKEPGEIVNNNLSNVSENSLELDNSNNLDNKNNKSSWGGPRPGAGRPDGSKNKKTLEEQMVKDHIRERVLKSIGKIVNSQMNLAEGCQYLYCIHKDKANGKEVKQKPRLVTNQYEIEQYLAGDFDNDKDDYYYITTERPNNMAIDSLVDRVIGTSAQVLKGDKENPLFKITIKGNGNKISDNGGGAGSGGDGNNPVGLPGASCI